MDKTVHPYSDIFVRYLLGDETNTDLLLSFINAVHEDYQLPLISSLSIKNPFNLKSYTIDKESAIDIKAEDEKHRQYDIEIQVAGNESYKHRSLYYWSKLYSSQISENDTYKKLKPAICINLLNFTLIDTHDKPHSCFVLKEMKNPDLTLTDHLLIHFIELPKFVKETSFSTIFEKWLAFFKFEGRKEAIMETIIKDEPILEKAHEKYNRFTSDEELMAVYEARIKYQMDYNTDVEYALEKGIEKGIEKGMKKGIEKGSKKRSFEIAKELLNMGFSVEQITRATGLTAEEIKLLNE